MTEDELAEIAAQFVARVREDDADANGRWLAEVCPEWGDRYKLLFILAAAVPHGPHAQSWLSLTAWTRVSPAGFVDEIAVERACRGDRMELNRAEVQAAVEILARRGLSDQAIAKTLGLSARTVLRRRHLQATA